MNLFVYIWGFIGVVLILQGIRTSKEGRVNKKAFIFAVIALVSALLNLLIK